MSPGIFFSMETFKHVACTYIRILGTQSSCLQNGYYGSVFILPFYLVVYWYWDFGPYPAAPGYSWICNQKLFLACSGNWDTRDGNWVGHMQDQCSSYSSLTLPILILNFAVFALPNNGLYLAACTLC